MPTFKPRTSKEIQEEYSRTCAELGEVTFRLHDMTIAIEDRKKKLTQLNQEYQTSVKREKEDKKEEPSVTAVQ